MYKNKQLEPMTIILLIAFPSTFVNTIIYFFDFERSIYLILMSVVIPAVFMYYILRKKKA
jgi:hypothetical protein